MAITNEVIPTLVYMTQTSVYSGIQHDVFYSGVLLAPALYHHFGAD